MDDFLEKVQELIERGAVKISEHGYDELADDDLKVSEIIDGVRNATIVEEYPDYPKGPCVLVHQKDDENSPVHAVWGIPAGFDEPAVLVTAYRPDPERWNESFTRRQSE